MKKSFLFLIACFLFNLAVHAQLNSDHVVGHYPLNGNADDMSPLNHHGSINGATITTDRFENQHGAYQFDGVDDYIITSANIDDSLGNAASFSAWIKFSGTETGRILSNYNGQGEVGNCNERIGFAFSVTDDSRLSIFYATDGNDYIGRKTDSGTIKPNTWHHVVATWNGSMNANAFQLYIDGQRMDVMDNNKGYVVCGFLESMKEFQIGLGDCAFGPCAAFEGKIDDVQIYSKVLDSSDIQSLYLSNPCHDVIYDTVTVMDTISVYDTVTIFDTVHVYDTITIYDSVTITDTLVIALNPTNVNTPIANTIKVFPNPTQEYINISIEGYENLQGYEITILNLTGQRLFSEFITAKEMTIDLASLGPAGIYLLQLLGTQGETIVAKKIVLK